MGSLISTEFIGVVTSLCRSPQVREQLINAEKVEKLVFTFEGVQGDYHSGITRAACTRVSRLHQSGIEIRNERQVTLVSVEELKEIAEALNLHQFDERWLGANILIEGIPDVSHLPPGSRLQGPDGVTLIVDLQNRPCSVVTQTINVKGHHGQGFISAAQNRRGVTLCVERPGVLHIGDELRLFVPNQRVWCS